MEAIAVSVALVRLQLSELLLTKLLMVGAFVLWFTVTTVWLRQKGGIPVGMVAMVNVPGWVAVNPFGPATGLPGPETVYMALDITFTTTDRLVHVSVPLPATDAVSVEYGLAVKDNVPDVVAQPFASATRMV